jgi:tetratricopeptide (TPR) repeat protein
MMRRLILPLGILLFALTIRAGHLADYRHSPAFVAPLIDAQVYDRLARRVAQAGPGVLETPFYQPPLYPLLLGAVYASAEGHPMAPRIFQSLLGVGTVGLLLLLTPLAGGRRRAAYWAAFLLAGYGPALYFEGELLPVTLVLTTSTAAILLFLAADGPSARRWHLPLAGLLLGLSIATRPTGILLAGAAAAWWVAPRGARLARTRALLPAAALLLAIVLPFTAANRYHGGETVLISTNGGINLYLGNGTGADSLSAIQPGAAWERLQRMPLADGVRTPGAESRWWMRRAWSEAGADPAAWAANLCRKAARLLDAREPPRNTDMEAWRRDSRVLSLPLASFALVAPLAMAGLLRGGLRGRSRALLLLALGAVAAQNLLFFPAARYRLEAVPLLCVFAGAGIDGILTRRWTRRDLPRCGLAVAAVAAVVWADLTGGREMNLTRTAINRGVALREAGRAREAEAAFRNALRADPHDPDAHRWLAETLLAREDATGALRHFDAALIAAPDYVRVLLGRAQAAELAGVSGAEDAYRRALAVDPYSTDVRLNYGVWLARAGRRDEAQEMFRSGLELEPGDTRFSTNLRRLRSGL